MKLEKRVKNERKGLEEGKIGEALQGDRRLMLGGGVTVWEKSDFLLVL